MSEFAIRIDGLSKQYQIGRLQQKSRNGNGNLSTALKAPFRYARRLIEKEGVGRGGNELFWALRDVSLEIKPGELVGIIGRNGAGKSTLLKILSRITPPTSGHAEIRGRVGSLLEVGTGFHPDLTGRENVYLNGAILGMGKAEINRKFDDIVAFAEIEKFLDTPVKHYSSGMFVRLGFAVAAHLDPEILMVDEVLAVGDARFQKRCLAKMDDVKQQGRTVIFVSHNMSTVSRLCNRIVLLEASRVVMDGEAHKVVNRYLNSGVGTAAVRDWDDPATAPGGDVARLRAVRVINDDEQPSDVIDIRRPVGLRMEFDVLKAGYVLMPHYHVFNEEGVLVFETLDLDPNWRRQKRPAGRYVCTAWVPGNFLSEGTLFVEAAVIVTEPIIPQFCETNVVSFQVVDSIDGDSARGDWLGRMTSAVRPMLHWDTDFEPAAVGSALGQAAPAVKTEVRT
jgi:lipopolysaccharide transport system ATP-binding protein